MQASTQQLAELYAQAQQAAEHAYAPYSRFRVGAALLCDDGAVVTGCNVENMSYGLTICAERSALFRAISERGATLRVAAVAVANLNRAASPPCGACRQVLSEFASPDALIVFPSEGGLPGAPVPFHLLFPFKFQLAQPVPAI